MEKGLIGHMEKILKVKGMSCTSCESKIERALMKIAGVRSAKADYARSSVSVAFDEQKVSTETLIGIINKLGYEAADHEIPQKNGRLAGIALIVIAAYLVIRYSSLLNFSFLPEIDPSLGYGLLFFIGVLTSLHCVAMCGGINLSQCVKYGSPDPGEENAGKWAKFRPAFLYNTGRVLSYTVIGGIAGALGSAVQFSGWLKGAVVIGSGIFMMIMGLNMLDIFPWLKKLNPHMPKAIGRFLTGDKNKSANGPYYIGLLNGLMPCGPLQSMQLYALGTGSFAAGALSMFLFSLGTVPLMFGLGAAGSFLKEKFAGKMMKVSAALVLILGLLMLNRGLALSGIAIPVPSGGLQSDAQEVTATLKGGFQTVSMDLRPGSYTPVTVQANMPVKWIIKASKDSINGCNNPISIPSLGITKKLAPGENMIEFDPGPPGTIIYTCWMGMIRSSIKVVEKLP